MHEAVAMSALRRIACCHAMECHVNQSGDEALQRKHLLDEASKLLQKAKANGEDDRKRAEMK